MFRSLQIAATGMLAQETQLNTVANNMANANTTGFKRQTAEFEDLLYQNQRYAGPTTDGGSTAPTQTQIGSGSRVVATSRSFAQGTLQQTGNTYDLGIQGPGFFQVMRPSGELAYTRAGALKLDNQGRIVTSDGFPLQPPVTVPNNATSVTIGSDGTVTATEPNQTAAVPLGQLQLATFTNSDGLNALGQNLFEATASSGQPLSGSPGVGALGTLQQGSLESSNVDIVNEMVNLISAQRAYEINSKVVTAADEMLRNATTMEG
jgi:flagellar basal-body rod protein FlgG